MAAEIVRILHSGFVAWDCSHLTQLKDPTQTTYQRLIEDTSFTINTKDYYDTGIADLIKRYYADPKLVKQIDFREEVIAAAFRVFAEDDVSQWFNMQMKFTNVTQTHLRYLEETIDYVLNSKRRTMSNANYRRILTGDSSGYEAVQKQADKAANRARPFGDSQFIFKNCYETKEFIYRWTTDLGSFEDMLESLNVIFGMRAERLA